SLQVTQLRRRVEPQLSRQSLAGAPVRVEGVGLAAGAVEREHELSVQPLAPGVFREQALEPRKRLDVLAQSELRLDEELRRLQALVLEVEGDVAHRWLAAEVGERPPAPEREGLAHASRRGVRLVVHPS